MYGIIALIIGFIIDYLIGDPYKLPHPIRWIGSFIAFGVKKVRRICRSESSMLVGGLFLCIATVALSGGLSYILIKLCYSVNCVVGVVAEAIICFYCLSAKQLKIESTKVMTRLQQGDTEGARYAVSMIVGRDTSVLDDKGIARAAVETVAENSSDGVVAPIIYMALFGGAGGMIYKAVNTLDSMVGYVDGDYLYIGRISAKLDDVLNYIPSRLSALLMIAAAKICGYDYRSAYKIWRRDCRKHASPNSAQTEAACAGALGLRLAGDAYYFGVLHKKEYIGDNIREIEPEDIQRVNRLMYMASVLCLIFVIIIKAVILWLW